MHARVWVLHASPLIKILSSKLIYHGQTNEGIDSAYLLPFPKQLPLPNDFSIKLTLAVQLCCEELGPYDPEFEFVSLRKSGLPVALLAEIVTHEMDLKYTCVTLTHETHYVSQITPKVQLICRAELVTGHFQFSICDNGLNKVNSLSNDVTMNYLLLQQRLRLH